MSHERGFRILKNQKTRFYLHGSSVFAFCYFWSFFVFLGDPWKIAVLPAWELNSGELDQQFCVFLVFWKHKKTLRVGFRARWAPRLSKPRFWHHFGGIWDRFCKVFWYNFGSVLYEKHCFTCMGAHFSKVSPYFVVSFLLAGISEIAVLPAWELIFSRICWKFRWPFFKDRNRKKMTFLRLSLFPLRARNGREEEKRREEKRREEKRREEKRREEKRREEKRVKQVLMHSKCFHAARR